MDVIDNSLTRQLAKKVQVLAGRIIEVGEDYVIVGSALSPIWLVDGLASVFHTGQRPQYAGMGFTCVARLLQRSAPSTCSGLLSPV
jgi:hypothetical protein